MPNKKYYIDLIHNNIVARQSIKIWADNNREYFQNFKFQNKQKNFPTTQKIAAVLTKLNFKKMVNGNTVIFTNQSKSNNYNYWIHSNKPTQKTTVHKAECGDCNNGIGKHQNKNGNKNSQWIGGFANINDACKHGENLATKNSFIFRLCKRCIGDIEAIRKPQLLTLDNLHFDYKGVYQIYAYNNKNAKPIPIGRLLNIDKTGLLYIGKSEQKEGVKARLKMFLSNTNNSKNNSHSAGFKIANNKNLKQFIIKNQLYYTCLKSSQAGADENLELTNYKNKYGEVPPLNG